MTYQMLILAGAAGIVLFLLIGLISFVVLRSKRKKLRLRSTVNIQTLGFDKYKN